MCVFFKNEGINREREEEGRKEEKVREKKKKRTGEYLRCAFF